MSTVIIRRVDRFSNVRNLDSEPAELARLYQDYFKALVQQCRFRAEDPHLAEDLAQQTLLQAVRQFSRAEMRPAWPWLRSVAVAIAARDSERPPGRWLTEVADDDPDVGGDTLPGDVDDWVAFGPALAAVPHRQRAALVVRYLWNWPIDDAAHVLEMEPNAFEVLVARARRRLAAEHRRLASPSPED